MGDPVRPLLWVSKSLDKLASALAGMGRTISPNSVRKLLTGLGFSRQSNRKADEGAHHPDRNAQFEHINGKALAAQAAGQPVISVDTKKKELVDAFRNGGGDYRPKGEPQRVNVHDFEDKNLARLCPMAFTISPPTKAGSALALRTIPPRSPWLRSGSGWREWAASVIRMPAR